MIKELFINEICVLSKPYSKACVFGCPIEQSKSPIIHNMFAKQFNLPLVYEKRLAPESGFVASANEFFADPTTIGANVTMPFKHDALAWVDELSSQAKQAGAVNTIIRKGEKFIGDNTDGYGLVSDLQEHNVTLKGANILLIGAGGAAQGALPALIDAGIEHVSIYNRSIEKAKALVTLSNAYKDKVASLYDNTFTQYDIIINATSLSLHGELPDLAAHIFANKPAVYDMVYQSKATSFLAHAKEQGCDCVIDGLGMLVHQAARSFYLWFGKAPDTKGVREYLRTLS